MADIPGLPPRYRAALPSRSHAAAESQQQAFEANRREAQPQTEVPLSQLQSPKEICERIARAVTNAFGRQTYRGEEFADGPQTQVEKNMERANKRLGKQLGIYVCVHVTKLPTAAIQDHMRASLKAMNDALASIHQKRQQGDIELRWLIEEICADLQVPEPKPAEVTLRKERKPRTRGKGRMPGPKPPALRAADLLRKKPEGEGFTYKKKVKTRMTRHAPIDPSAAIPLTDAIVTLVARALKLKAEKIKGKRKRYSEVSFAASIALWFVAQHTGFNTVALGRLFLISHSNAKERIDLINAKLAARDYRVVSAIKRTLEQMHQEAGVGVVPLPQL